ncbi:DNA methyltransferase [Nonomuraea sp. NPDC050404]|uniref:DNA methyltransferase n=1 Tax=Nonomuraea sp. NPDC050404 TaxID=3155783 RepID=UPI0033C85940
MPEPYYTDDMVTVHVGDCRQVLPRVLADDSVDAICCDPPYELSFMGRGWDASGVAFDPVTWSECLRVAKPGAHLLAFGGTRTWHRVAVAIEDAGWELRDTIMWIYGSGFPKSLDVGKAIDRAAGAKREVIGNTADFSGRTVGRGTSAGYHGDLVSGHCRDITAPATEEAARWDGWGTALKPGWEPIILARKPLAGTVAQNVQAYGTGALNIDACRIEAGPRPLRLSDRTNGNDVYGDGLHGSYAAGETSIGRWPANVVFTHHAACVEDGPCEPDCPVADLDRQSGKVGGHSVGRLSRTYQYAQRSQVPSDQPFDYGDSGGASRFFPVFRYEAKAPASERPKLDDGTAHATVKPLDLIRWLTRLITPPGGLVLDPFGGSGTTAEAATIEGFRSVLVELEPPHAELIKARLSKPVQPVLDFGGGAS